MKTYPSDDKMLELKKVGVRYDAIADELKKLGFRTANDTTITKTYVTNRINYLKRGGKYKPTKITPVKAKMINIEPAPTKVSCTYIAVICSNADSLKALLKDIA